MAMANLPWGDGGKDLMESCRPPGGQRRMTTQAVVDHCRDLWVGDGGGRRAHRRLWEILATFH